ncbi:MAG: ATP-binding protein [Ruminococcus sp.]|nr:ATP-binding protein [Ruminococcus sp.]
MEKTSVLLNKKYRSLLISTLAMSASSYISMILDGIMVGQILGTAQLSAINLTTSILFLMNIPVALFNFGGNTLSVMFKGKRDNASADKAFTLSFAGGMLSSVLFCILGILLISPVAQLLSKGTELKGYVSDYLLPLWVLAPLMAFVTMTASFSRTDGLRKLATALPIVSNVINLLCDLLFMKVLDMGIAGAGWATVAGYSVGAVMALVYFRSDKRSVHFTASAFKSLNLVGSIAATGLPSALIYVCNFLRLFFVNDIILSSTGVMGAKIASVTFSLNSLSFIFVEGASMTLLPILGALSGEKDIRGQKSALRYGMFMTLVMCSAVFAVSVIFPTQLASLYGLTDPETVDIFAVTFRIVSINVLIIGIIYVLRSFFQATGQKMIANILVVLDGFATVVPLMYFLSKINIYMLWASFPISKAVTLAVLFAILAVMKRRKHTDDILLLGSEEGKVLDFSVKNDPAEAGNAARKAIAFCKENGVDPRIANAIGVTAEELCSNIAQYAASKQNPTVDICIRIFENSVTIRLRDNGEAFDPTEYIDDSGETVTGLGLVRSLSSKIEHNRVLDMNITSVTVERSDQAGS